MVDVTSRRARLATFGVFALNGFVLGLWVVNIPAILDRTGTSTVTLGSLLLLMGACAWLGMQISGRLIDVLGSRRVTTVAGVLVSLSLLGPGTATSTAQLAVGVALLGLANGTIDVAQNAHAVEVERRYARPVMSAFHAFFSLGGLAAAAAGGLMIATGVTLPVAMSAGAVAGVATALACSRLLLVTHVERPETLLARPAAWTGRLALLAVLAFALMLAEGVAYDWSTVHLEDELGSSHAVAAWAFGAFSVTMTAVRLLADRLVARFGAGPFVRVAAITGAAGLTIASLSDAAPLAIAGWAVFGVGLAGCVPQLFSTAGHTDAEASGSAIAKVAGTGYVGLLAGPAVIGLLTSWVPLSTAFAVPIAGCLVAGILAPRALEVSA